MKKTLVIWILLCTVLLTGCSVEDRQSGDSVQGANISDGVDTEGTDSPEARGAVYSGILVDVSESSLLIAGDAAGDIVRVSADLPCEGAESYAVGQTVEIPYNGTLLETYPAQLCEPVGVSVTGNDAGLLAMYESAIRELWDSDSGLLQDMTVLGYDLSESGLPLGVSEALAWMVAEDHGLEPVKGNSEELAELGYIDKEHVVFTSGVLLKLSAEEDGGKKKTVELSLWRAGDGAVGVRCKAKLKSGKWTYEVTENWIS